MGTTLNLVEILPSLKLSFASWNVVTVYVPTDTLAFIVTLLPLKVIEGFLGDTVYEKAPLELDFGGVIWKEKGTRLYFWLGI